MQLHQTLQILETAAFNAKRNYNGLACRRAAAWSIWADGFGVHPSPILLDQLKNANEIDVQAVARSITNFLVKNCPVHLNEPIPNQILVLYDSNSDAEIQPQSSVSATENWFEKGPRP